jgi:serine/threonine protein kinase
MLQHIDRYIIKERIGAGGQATVYLAHDPELNRDVAVKVPHQMASVQTEYWDALREEARRAARLSHINIATVYDFRVDGDYACIVMEYFPNSLDRVLSASGAMSPSRVVDIVTQVCDALSYAHETGFVHRDIKPHNILLDADGIPKVTDFGLARAADLSVAASAIGTHPYMSPEQWRADESPDLRSDIYSLGVTMYEMLSGHTPFQGPAHRMPQMHRNDPVPDFPSSLGVPKTLETIVRKCMEKDPDGRYQSAREVASDLKEFTKPRSARGQDADAPNNRGLAYARLGSTSVR